MGDSEPRFRQPLKCVVVGDGGVGKTSLLMSFTAQTFPTEYNPTIFDNFNATVTLDDKVYSLALWDTAGQEEYDKMRTVSYPHTNVFVLCFSLVGLNSFANIKNRWYPELKEYCPETPILLVGTKLDLTNDDSYMRGLAKQGLSPVTRIQALELVEELGLAGYLECSGLTTTGVKIVFEEAAALAANKPLKVANKQSRKPDRSTMKRVESRASQPAYDKKNANSKNCCLL